MTCWVCNPTCDHCKPKFITCPTCNTQGFLTEPTCRACGYAFTQDEKDAARAAWRASRDTGLTARLG